MDVYTFQAIIYISNALVLLGTYLYFWHKSGLNWIKLVFLPSIILLAAWSVLAAYQAKATTIWQWEVTNALVYTVTPLISVAFFFAAYKFYIVELHGHKAGRYYMKDFAVMTAPLIIAVTFILYVWIVTIRGIEPNLWFIAIVRGETTGYGMWRELHAILWYLHISIVFVSIFSFIGVQLYILIKGHMLLLKKWSWLSVVLALPISILSLGMYSFITGVFNTGIIIDITPLGATVFYVIYFIALSKYNVLPDNTDSINLEKLYSIKSGYVYRLFLTDDNRYKATTIITNLLKDISFLQYKISIVSVSRSNAFVRLPDNKLSMRIYQKPDKNTLRAIETYIDTIDRSEPKKTDIFVLNISGNCMRTIPHETHVKFLEAVNRYAMKVMSVGATGIIVLENDLYEGSDKRTHRLILEKITRALEDPLTPSSNIGIKDFYNSLTRLETSIDELNKKEGLLKKKNKKRIEYLRELYKLIERACADYEIYIHGVLPDTSTTEVEEIRESLEHMEHFKVQLKEIVDLMEGRVSTNPSSVKLDDILSEINILSKYNKLGFGDMTVIVDKELVIKAYKLIDVGVNTYSQEDGHAFIAINNDGLILTIEIEGMNLRPKDIIAINEPFSAPFNKYSPQKVTIGSHMFLARRYLELSNISMDFTIKDGKGSFRFFLPSKYITINTEN